MRRVLSVLAVLGALLASAPRARAADVGATPLPALIPVPVESPAGLLRMDRSVVRAFGEASRGAPPCTPDPICEPPPDPCAPVDPCKSPWTFTAGLALSLAKGNSDSFDLAADASAKYARYPWGFLVQALFAYGEKDGSTSTEAWHVTTAGERHLNRRLYAFARVDFDRDVPADLESRWTGLAGLGAKLIDARTITLKGEAGFGYTWEKRVAMARTGDPAAYVGLQYAKTWDDGASLDASWKFVPNLGHYDLSLMTWQAKFAKPLNGSIDLTVTLRVDRVIDPPAPAEATDILLAVGLRAKF